MAKVETKNFNSATLFKCDKCGKTKPYSLTAELNAIARGDISWYHSDNNKALCPLCYKDIISAWYNQKEVVNYSLQSDTSNKKRKSNVTA